MDELSRRLVRLERIEMLQQCERQVLLKAHRSNSIHQGKARETDSKLKLSFQEMVGENTKAPAALLQTTHYQKKLSALIGKIHECTRTRNALASRKGEIEQQISVNKAKERVMSGLAEEVRMIKRCANARKEDAEIESLNGLVSLQMGRRPCLMTEDKQVIELKGDEKNAIVVPPEFIVSVPQYMQSTETTTGPLKRETFQEGGSQRDNSPPQSHDQMKEADVAVQMEAQSRGTIFIGANRLSQSEIFLSVKGSKENGFGLFDELRSALEKENISLINSRIDHESI